MRLDARKGDTGYYVWLADECRVPKSVVWVDDVTNEWGEYSTFFPFEEFVTHQARAIKIYLDRRLIIINPIADDEPAEIIEAIGVTA